MRSLNRRLVLQAALVTALPAAAATARAQDGPTSAREFVRLLYDREITRQLGMARMAEAEFLAMFTRDTQQVWLAARSKGSNATEGPVLNAFFGWGVLPRHQVRLARIVAADAAGNPPVAVYLDVQGQRRRVELHVVRENGEWRVSDMTYDHGESFLAHFRRRARM